MQKQRVYLVNSAIDTTCTNHNFCLARFCFVLVFFFNFNFVLIFLFLFYHFIYFFGIFFFVIQFVMSTTLFTGSCSLLFSPIKFPFP